MTSRIRAGLVLVHGGCHQGSAWRPMLPYLRHPALVVDLPGRNASARELSAIGIDTCAQAVVGNIEEAGFERVVLVGHSLAGVILPEVVRRLPERIGHVVYLSAVVPPNGRNALDMVPRPIRAYARIRARSGRLTPMPRPVARRLFCNDLDEGQTRAILRQFVPEAARLTTEAVYRPQLPIRLPTTYVMTRRDRVLPLRAQRRQIANLGRHNVDVVCVDSGHESFAGQPAVVARTLDAIADRFDTFS